jgi:hypothetical protein
MGMLDLLVEYIQSLTVGERSRTVTAGEARIHYSIWAN